MSLDLFANCAIRLGCSGSREAGNDRIALLRCVSAYPARPDAMNLHSIETLKAFGTVVGLSDHTRDATVAVASVALGAKVIEKHFILDRAQGGPDAFFSLEPEDFKSMVAAVRAAEAALGAPRFGVSPEEKASATFRRSLFVARDIAAGAVLTCDDVRSVRPAHGMDARHLPATLGRTAAQALTAGTPLTWEAIGPAPALASVELRAPAEAKDDQTRARFVAWSNGVSIGQSSLQAAGTQCWEVSVALAADARAEGLLGALIAAMEAPARERGAVLLTARIRKGDEASVRAFKAAGYYAFVERRVADQDFYFCERRIVPYA